MELNRSNIKKFMDDKYSNTEYYKKIKDLNEFLIMEDMKLNDLDYLYILRDLLLEIKNNYESLTSSVWKPSKRQEYLIESLNNTLTNLINKNNYVANRYYIQDYRDFYFEVWDYFDDYHNQNEEIVKEEMDQIILILDKFLNFFNDIIKE